MLLELFPRLQQNKFLILLNKFFYSIFYLIFIATLTAVTCIFGIEMYTFYVYVFCGFIFPCLFCKDMTPTLAVLGMAYSSVSIKTKNAKEDLSLFVGRWHHLIIVASLIFACVIARLIYELVTKKEVRKYKHYLLFGYLIFGITLILGGIFSPYYTGRDALFGLVEFLALFGSYFLLMYLIKWKEMKKDYFFYMMMFYGLALVAEVIYSLIVSKWYDTRTGWGLSNNVAAQLCLCVCAPFYLAAKKRISPLYVTAAGLIIIATCFTNSRTGSLMCVILMVAGFTFSMIKGKGWKKRLAISITSTVILVAFFTVFFIFLDFFKDFFYKAFDEKHSIFYLSGREGAWTKGYHIFLENPRFGAGWYYLNDYRDYNFVFDFIPSRYHNTLFQLIGTCGAAGLLAYIYHRYQTIRMTFTKPNLEKIFMFLSILGLTLTSIFDCHFFNLGPGLNYCIALAFIEGVNIKEGINPKRPTLFKILSTK